jgi:hypothetical protein
MTDYLASVDLLQKDPSTMHPELGRHLLDKLKDCGYLPDMFWSCLDRANKLHFSRGRDYLACGCTCLQPIIRPNSRHCLKPMAFTAIAIGCDSILCWASRSNKMCGSGVIDRTRCLVSIARTIVENSCMLQVQCHALLAGALHGRREQVLLQIDVHAAVGQYHDARAGKSILPTHHGL